MTTLERNVARAARRLWRQTLAGITLAQRERLEALLMTPDGSRQSPLDRLRDSPVLQSPAELARAVGRLDKVRTLAASMPRTDRLPRTRVLALARFTAAAKAHAVERLPEDRRLATLVAFIGTLEATAQYEILDLFDVVVTRIFTDAFNIGREARKCGLRDLDAAALTLREGFSVLLAHGDDYPRDSVFATVPRMAVEAAITRVDALVRPVDDPSRLPELGGDKPKRSKFADYAIGYFHIDIAEVRTEEGKLYLFVAIDRTSKLAFSRLEKEATRQTAANLLRSPVEVVPYQIHTVLTDNGIQFCHAPRYRSGPTAHFSKHLFDRVCRDDGIEHRLTKPNLLDQRSGRADEPNAQRGHRQTLPLREPRAARNASAVVHGCLQPRTSAEDPARPDILRIRLLDLDGRAGSIQDQPVTPYSVTIHL